MPLCGGGLPLPLVAFRTSQGGGGRCRRGASNRSRHDLHMKPGVLVGISGRGGGMNVILVF